MSDETRKRDQSPESIEERARLVRELTENPGTPDLDSLTSFVRLVHLRLFGVAHDRDHAIDDRVAAAIQLGREALAAGEDDTKGVRPEVRQLLHALHGHETADPDGHTPRMLEAIESALQHC